MPHTAPLSTSQVTAAEWKYPAAECLSDGMLQVDDNPPHKIYWAEYGNPLGEPVMFLHGGPGGSCDPQHARFFDPRRYRIILFDQRGCGKSRPSVSSDGPRIALSRNTTDDLVSDIVKLRDALEIKGKMHVFGGSWGSTLAIAYAIKHPDTVATLILRGIFIGSAQDLHYLYQGNAATYKSDPHGMTQPGTYISFPEAWKVFVEAIPHEKRGDMIAAYKEIFDAVPTSESERVAQIRAAGIWSRWESATSHLVPEKAETGNFANDAFTVCFAQIEAHYFANNLFMPQGYLLENVKAFAHIPVHIVHGRFDQVCPLTQAEALVTALKQAGATPVSYVKPTAGHGAFEIENYLALTHIMDTLPHL